MSDGQRRARTSTLTATAKSCTSLSILPRVALTAELEYNAAMITYPFDVRTLIEVCSQNDVAKIGVTHGRVHACGKR